MTRAYTPIACGFYDVFEIAIMRGQQLKARWTDDDRGVRDELIRPLNLTIRDRAEWLIAEDQQGRRLNLRLDRIKSADTSRGHE